MSLQPKHKSDTTLQRLPCELIVWSDNGWIQQILTGLSMLHEREFISLRQTIVPQTDTSDAKFARQNGHLQIIINDQWRLHYDLSDHATISRDALQSCDFYFKRSYDPVELAAELDAADRARIFPLGMNYPVIPDRPDRFAIRRALKLFHGTDRLRQVMRLLDVHNWLSFVPRLRQAEAQPDLSDPPLIFFLTRAWNPDDSTDHDSSKSRDFESLNAMRAECIRELRKAFPAEQLVTGFTYTPYGAEHFPDLILDDRSIATRRRYLEALRSCAICIATEGLHNSNPWKMGEYISLSKAIVSEPLHHTVPGGFEKNTHYLEFRSPEECVSAVRRLSEDGRLRRQMMLNNLHFYHAYQRPDLMVINSIVTALSASSSAFENQQA